MAQSTTPPPAPSTADQPVRVRHAACPKCDGPVFYHPDRWLYCTRCSALRRPIRFTIVTTTEGTK